MATSELFSTIRTPDGNPIPGVPIVAKLVPPAAFKIDSPTELIAPVVGVTDDNGEWTLTLEQQVNIEPVGSYYIVEERLAGADTGSRRYAVSIGAIRSSLAAAEVHPLEDYMTQTFLTQQAADQRYLQIGGTVFDDLTVTDDLTVGDTLVVAHGATVGSLLSNGRNTGAAIVFGTNDTTPSVALGNVFTTANAAATSVTTFDDGIAGQVLVLIFGDNNTTLVNGATLALQSGANFVGATGEVLSFVRTGTVWREISRSRQGSAQGSDAYVEIGNDSPTVAGTWERWSTEQITFAGVPAVPIVVKVWITGNLYGIALAQERYGMVRATVSFDGGSAFVNVADENDSPRTDVSPELGEVRQYIGCVSRLTATPSGNVVVRPELFSDGTSVEFANGQLMAEWRIA